MTYNLNSANPFQATAMHTEWHTNNLILTDREMRRKAGVSVLDSDISEIFNKKGGGATGAPFHVSKYGSQLNSSTYDQKYKHDASSWIEQPLSKHKLATEQSGSGYPMHYYTNNGKW